MLSIKCTFICSFLLFLHAGFVESSCVEKREMKDTIADSFRVYGGDQYEKCWKILNPAKNIIFFHLKEFKRNYAEPKYGNLTIWLMDGNKTFTFWHYSASGNITTSSKSVVIRFRVDSSGLADKSVVSFSLQYEMDASENARSKTIAWLKSQRSPMMDWRENTLKVITALYLAGNATFDGTDIREELLISRAEFLALRALQRYTISEIDLSSYINFLRVTCNSPRHFASYDLIEKLQNQLKSSDNFTHPSIYLSLCNAHEKWPQRAVTDLTNILNSKSENIFLKDVQALALMAISCQMNQTDYLTQSEKSSLLPIYRAGIAKLKKTQLADGSFGDIHETAIAIQTLISTDGELSYDWNPRSAIRYITSQLNSSEIDFQGAYLSLPLLNWKSLADISKRNCTGISRNNDLSHDTTGTEIEVPEDRVRYSLFIGDERKLIRTITFRNPDNFTAYQVMLLAEIENVKFKFQWKRVSGKMYVEEISRIPNDPETGKCWLLYLGSNERKPLIPYFSKGPDEIILRHGDHLIMWYKTAKI